MPDASFGFHLARTARADAILWNANAAADIQDWINQNGGLQSRVMWLRAPEIFRFFRKC